MNKPATWRRVLRRIDAALAWMLEGPSYTEIAMMSEADIAEWEARRLAAKRARRARRAKRKASGEGPLVLPDADRRWAGRVPAGK